jgi:Ca-activated chloride channel family protein
MKKLITLLLFLTVSNQLFAQELTVTGTITDEAGMPLPGANVIENGTTNGKTADFDGKYEIKVAKGNTLVFSYVGFESQEIKVKNSTLNVQLKSGQALESVVITAYGSRKNSSKVSSAVAIVTSESIEQVPTNSTHQVLNGQASGIRINGGNQNLSSQIVIRGRSSLREDFKYHQTSTTQNESYKEINENTFKRTALAPLSTFSIDVDKASYSNIRRMLNNGQEVPVDAVKIEEMINYFEYDYAQPANEHP